MMEARLPLGKCGIDGGDVVHVGGRGATLDACVLRCLLLPEPHVCCIL